MITWEYEVCISCTIELTTGENLGKLQDLLHEARFPVVGQFRYDWGVALKVAIPREEQDQLTRMLKEFKASAG